MQQSTRFFHTLEIDDVGVSDGAPISLFLFHAIRFIFQVTNERRDASHEPPIPMQNIFFGSFFPFRVFCVLL